MTATSATPSRILDGRYELQVLIGQGTFGRVYRGHDNRLNRSVAVKVIKPWWIDDPEWVERFEREAQLMARVSHPGIVQVHDIGHDQGSLYYVAELVDGESLAARLRRGPVSPRQARDIAEQLCWGLAEAHAERVVHRDIKPANVLIDRGGRVKLGDFGIARLAEGTGEGAPATVAGTPGYMAPEQARGHAPTPASDVYSVGVVLSEMLGEARPPALVEVLAVALAERPSDRYRTAREMALALAAADLDARAEPSPAPGAAPPRPPARTRVRAKLTPRVDFNPSERRRYRAIAVGVVLLLLGMIVTSVVTASGSARVPNLLGLARSGITARAHARHLKVSFSTRYAQAASGTAIAQRPAAGRRVGDGSIVRVVLSAGPAPVAVPQLVGQHASDARAILDRLGLGAAVRAVPAPGVTPGLVVAQSPLATRAAAAHSTVQLAVAETPRWRALSSFSGDGAGRSVPFRIRGTRWRLVYSMGWDGTCGLLGLFCSGPTASVTKVADGSPVAHLNLNNGSGQTALFTSGPGIYEITVAPGSDGAHWSIAVQDDY